jgi:hypothetical protein
VREIDLAVQDLGGRAERAREILVRRRADLEIGVRLLIERDR